MDYWNDIITEKSWETLQKIRKLPISFILIGGWAAYLWTKLHKSKDIDIIVKNFDDLKYLKENYDLRKNDRLKKYEIKIEDIDIDIYVPYYSNLAIDINEISKHTTKIENFNVVSPETLLILKQGAEKDREYSVKGTKDRIDIVALLLFSEINFDKYRELLEKFKLIDFRERLKKILIGFRDINYLNLNPREFKLKKEKILKKI